MQNFAFSIAYGTQDIVFEVQYMSRKTLEIAVHPDKRVVIKAPQYAAKESIETRVRKRARWITKQITYFSQFEPRTPPRQYVGGESHLYLGRKYRLKFLCSEVERIALKNGYFYIESTSTNPENAKKLLEAWYKERAKAIFTQILQKSFEKFAKYNLDMPKLSLCTMKTRWGSYSTKGILRLNTLLIQAPKECIEYVITHELCHMLHHNHSKEFYTLLEQILPDWSKRKYKLEVGMV